MSDAVSDASPLIVLAKSNLLHILPGLFTRVFVPQAVADEVQAGPANDPLKLALPGCGWICPVRLEPLISPLSVWQAGSGEAEVIEYARLHGNLPVLLDDRAARRAAQALGLKVHGTVGLVAAATLLGKVQSFSKSIADLKAAGLYVSDSVTAAVEKGLKRSS
jgi:predicted nucleic acid-binding protein